MSQLDESREQLNVIRRPSMFQYTHETQIRSEIIQESVSRALEKRNKARAKSKIS